MDENSIAAAGFVSPAIILSALIIITSNVIATLYGAAFGAEAAKMASGNIVVWMFGGIAVCHILIHHC